MFTPSDILAGIVLPAVVCGLVYGAGWRLWRRRGAVGSAAWVPAVALTAGLVAGILALEGWPGLPPLEVAGWLPWIALGAMAAGLGRRAGLATGLVLRSLLALAIPLLTLRPLIEHRWGGVSSVFWVGGVAVALFVLGLAVDRLAVLSPGARVPLALWSTVTATAVCIVIAGSARLSQLTAILAAVLGAVVVAALLRGTASHDGGSTAAFAVFGALLLNGFFYLDDLPATATILLAVAPLGAWTRFRAAGWKNSALAAAMVLLPLAAALALTWAAMPDDPYGY